MSDWINVDEDVPEPGVDVIISEPEGIELGFYSPGEDDEVDNMGFDEGFIGYRFAVPGRSFGTPGYQSVAQSQPTHWMPLPEAPAPKNKPSGTYQHFDTEESHQNHLAEIAKNEGAF